MADGFLFVYFEDNTIVYLLKTCLTLITYTSAPGHGHKIARYAVFGDFHAYSREAGEFFSVPLSNAVKHAII